MKENQEKKQQVFSRKNEKSLMINYQEKKKKSFKQNHYVV